jgi:3-deoxy-D-manno-octulosonic-acid transferase
MWLFLYNVLLIAGSPVILLILLSKARCRRGLAERLGFGRYREAVEGDVVWIHAVSLGEVVAAVPLVRRLHGLYPGYRIIVTTVTETGREAVEQRLPAMAIHRYAPLDFPWVVARVVARLNPAVFLFVETELWPNLLGTLAKHGVPGILVNGRLSSTSFGRYRYVRPLMSRMLKGLSYCLMQSQRDAERVVALGAPADRVISTGNIKFDQPMPDPAQDTLPRSALLAEGEALIVAGSTHPGEEERLVECYRTLLKEFPSLVLLLAPRHIERAAQVEAMILGKGLASVRRSGLRSADRSVSGPRVLILDTRGELAGVYRHAAVAFVGGTLVPIGGHNLLEPAAWGKPVFFGSYTDHCLDVARLLLAAGGARQVRDGAQLTEEMARVLRDPGRLQTMGERAEEVLRQNRGALDRSLRFVSQEIRTRSREERSTVDEGGLTADHGHR